MPDSLAAELQSIRQLLQNGELESADQQVRGLLQSAPENAEALALAAQVQRRKHKPLAAIEFMHHAARAQPQRKGLWLSYAADLAAVGRIDAAEAALSQVTAIQPGDPQARLQLSLLQYLRGDYRGAYEALAALLQQHPGFAMAELELAYVLLMRGQWQAGWAAYEARYKLPHTRALLPRLATPQWDGRDVDGSVVLIADQGYGDCFQFCRYIPLVAKRCRDVVLMRSPQLAEVLDSVAGISASYARWEDLPAHQAHCTLSGLPRVFATTPETIPDGQNLLSIDAATCLRWRDKVERLAAGKRLRIGLAWSGRLDFRDNFLRSLPVQGFAPLLALPDCSFFSLQFGALAAQADALGMLNTTAEQTPFAEAAGLMQALDLIVTVDTASAHLAGALGRPTWLLLNATPDWRWRAHGTRSDWYPSVRLFRQDQTRSWLTVIAAVHAALAEICAATDPGIALAAFMRRPESHAQDYQNALSGAEI